VEEKVIQVIHQRQTVTGKGVDENSNRPEKFLGHDKGAKVDYDLAWIRKLDIPTLNTIKNLLEIRFRELEAPISNLGIEKLEDALPSPSQFVLQRKQKRSAQNVDLESLYKKKTAKKPKLDAKQEDLTEVSFKDVANSLLVLPYFQRKLPEQKESFPKIQMQLYSTTKIRIQEFFSKLYPNEGRLPKSWSKESMINKFVDNLLTEWPRQQLEAIENLVADAGRMQGSNQLVLLRINGRTNNGNETVLSLPRLLGFVKGSEQPDEIEVDTKELVWGELSEFKKHPGFRKQSETTKVPPQKQSETTKLPPQSRKQSEAMKLHPKTAS